MISLCALLKAVFTDLVSTSPSSCTCPHDTGLAPWSICFRLASPSLFYSLLMSLTFQSMWNPKFQLVILKSFSFLFSATLVWKFIYNIYSIGYRVSYKREKKWSTLHLLFFKKKNPIYGNFKQKHIFWQQCQGKFCFSDLRKDKLLFLKTFYTNLTTTTLSAFISLTFNKIHSFLLVIKLPRDLLSTNVLQSILGSEPLSELPLKAAG